MGNVANVAGRARHGSPVPLFPFFSFPLLSPASHAPYLIIGAAARPFRSFRAFALAVDLLSPFSLTSIG